MPILNASELQRLPIHGQLLAFARSYLAAAEVLCERLSATEDSANYADGAVVMSLAFHSLELLFKAGILKAEPLEQFSGKSGHDLTALSARFFKLYPTRDFQFEVPFRYELAEFVEPMREEELVALRAYAREQERCMPQDQRHRYPIDIDGKPWNGIFGFEPHTFLAMLQDLQKAYARIHPQLNAC
ncbi:MAG: hypothetical protein IAE86_22065 [Burkholderiaceae bacterium]|nr:hypothetical protein [Burkholderiaceae bacterium]